jgi:putative transcription factor
VETVNKSISKTIMEARGALNMKQKDLANKINVQPQIIQQYENGKATPDVKILQKLERVLKCKLTGKGFTK